MTEGWTEIDDDSKTPKELGWKDGCLIGVTYKGSEFEAQVPSYEEAYGDQVDNPEDGVNDETLAALEGKGPDMDDS